MSTILALVFPLWIQVADLEKIPLTLPNGTTLQIEIAQTQEERETGLMGRMSLGPNQGMLFIFENSGRYDFWMKNTLIPLDIIWLDHQKRIIHIEERIPPCKTRDCPSYGPSQKSRFVLELGAGMAHRHGLTPGNFLDF